MVHTTHKQTYIHTHKYVNVAAHKTCLRMKCFVLQVLVCVCVFELLNMLFSLHVCVCVNTYGPAFIRFNCALFEVKRTEAVCQIHSEI